MVILAQSISGSIAWIGVGGPVNVVDGNCDTNEMNTTSAP